MTTGKPATVDDGIEGLPPIPTPTSADGGGARQGVRGEMTELITADGIVTRWPKKNAERRRVLAHLAQFFELGRTYREAEVNEILRAYHTFEDWALLRREMFEARIFDRDPKTQTYWRLDPPPAGS